MNPLLFSVFFVLTSAWRVRTDGSANTIVVIQKKTFKHDGRIYENARTYRELIENSDVFIDKTTLITKLYEFRSIQTLLILAYPGWLKSINLHMVKSFFEIEMTDEGAQMVRERAPNYRLFRHGQIVHKDGEVEELKSALLISQHAPFIDLFQGKYPVIFVSFENVSAGTYEEFLHQVGNVISEIFQKYAYLRTNFQSLNDESFFNNKENKTEEQMVNDDNTHTKDEDSIANLFGKILNGTANADELIDSLWFLSKLLYRFFGQKAYVMVDDYDCIFDSLFNHNASEDDQQSIRKFYSSLLIKTMQTNDFIVRSIITGTYDVRSLLDGFYAATRLNMTDTILYNAFSMTGFDVDSMFRAFPCHTELDKKSRSWFNGYRSGRLLTKRLHEFPSFIRVHNNKNVSYFQLATPADSFIQKSLEVKWFRGMLCNIVTGKTYLREFIHFDHAVIMDLKKIPLQADSPVEQDDRRKYLTLLQASGYFTDKKNFSDTCLQVPNHRIKYKLSEMIMEYYRIKYNILPHFIDNVIFSMYNYMVEDNTDCAPLARSLYEFFTHFPLQTDIYPFHLLNYVLNYFALRITNMYSLRLLDLHTSLNDPTVYIALYSPEIKIIFGARISSLLNERTLMTLYKWENCTTYAPKPNRTKFIALGIPLHGDYQIYQNVIHHDS